LILLPLLSCSRKNEVQFDSLDNGYLVYNHNDSLEFDKNWSLINSTVSLIDSFSKVSFKNDKLINIHNWSKSEKYIIWFDSLFTPMYVANDEEVYNPLVTSFQYGENSKLDRLIINYDFILDGHIKVVNLDQYLIYKNKEIDTLESTFYVVKELDSGGVFKLFSRHDIDENYYYQVIYYTDPFIELSPVVISGNLYVKDTSKHKDVLYFRKGEDPFIAYDNLNEKPTVFQVYVFENNTRKLLEYRLGVVRPDFSSEEKITQLKNDLSEKFNQFNNKSYLKDIEKSLEGFPFVSIKSQGVVEVDKEKLKELYSKYNGKE